VFLLCLSKHLDMKNSYFLDSSVFHLYSYPIPIFLPFCVFTFMQSKGGLIGLKNIHVVPVRTELPTMDETTHHSAVASHLNIIAHTRTFKLESSLPPLPFCILRYKNSSWETFFQQTSKAAVA
jgi:hypothetical protein